MSLYPSTPYNDEANHAAASELDTKRIYLVDSLRRPKKQPQDIDRIYETVRGLKFFNSLFASCEDTNNSDNIRKLCSNLKYESIEMGAFVFKQNEPSNDKFYVILSGEVGILTETNYSEVLSNDKKHYENTIRKSTIGRRLTQLNKQPSHEPALSERSEKHIDEASATSSLSLLSKDGNQKDLKSKSVFTMANTVKTAKNLKKATEKFIELKARRNAVKTELIEEEKELEDTHTKEFELMVARYGHLARILAQGDHFGDGALKNPGSKRSASVLCKTDCEFLVLDADTYSNFARKNAEKKNEFLLKCFSFISSVSSSQIKNKIVYSFMSEGYTEGYVLMDEGVVLKEPKLYLIEHGECKLEKKHIVKIPSPLDRKDIISSQTHWLTICTVGPGTLLGEEILEYPKNEEQYEYRVTVTSSRLSVLTILRSSFEVIHTELEDQTRLFYHEKKKHRDEIYKQMVHELETKLKKTNGKILGSHVGFARMLNKSSFKVFTQRTIRNSQVASNPLYKNMTMERDDSSQKNLTDKTRQLNETGWDVLRVNSPERKYSITGNQALRVNTEGADTRQLHSPTLTARPNKNLKNQTAIGPNTSLITSVKENSPAKETINRHKLEETNTQPLKLLANPRNSLQMPPLKSQTSNPPIAKTDNVTAGSQNHPKEAESQPVLEKSQNNERFLLEPASKGHSKTIRVRPEAKDESSPRYSTQEMLQTAFLEKLKLPMPPDNGDPDNLKFVFDEDKEAHQKLILKQKTLKKGAFANSKTVDYLKHNYRPSTALLTRISKGKNSDWITDDSIVVNSPRSQLVTLNCNSEQYERNHPNCNISPLFSPIGARSQRVTLAEVEYKEPNFSYSTGMVCTENSPKQFPRAYSLYLTEATPKNIGSSSVKKTGTEIETLGHSPDSLPESSGGPFNKSRKQSKAVYSMSFKSKKPFYQNLLQKSAMHKRLNLKTSSIVEKTDYRNSLPYNSQKISSEYFY